MSTTKSVLYLDMHQIQIVAVCAVGADCTASPPRDRRQVSRAFERNVRLRSKVSD